MKRPRLFWVIFPGYVLVTIGLILLAAWYSERLLRDFYLNQSRRFLEALAQAYQHSIGEQLSAVDPAELQRKAEAFGRDTGVRLTVVLASGKVLADSEHDPRAMENHRERPEIRTALETGESAWADRYSHTVHFPLRYVAVPVREDGQIVGVVRAGMSLGDVEEALRWFEYRIWLAAGVAFVALLLAGVWLLGYRISKPLKLMTEGARRFAAGDLDYRLPAIGAREIATLAEALNDMAAQLRDQMETIAYQRSIQDAVMITMEEAVMTLDNQGRITSMNAAAGRLFQVDPLAVAGKGFYEVLRKAALIELIERTASSTMPVQQEVAWYDGQKRVLSAYGSVLRGPGNEKIGLLLVLRDLTRLRQLENVRREFVANASHELRTPITSIKGFVETLLEGGLEDKQNAERFLQIIHQQVNRLGALVNDILSLATIEKDDEERAIAMEVSPLLPVLEAARESCAEKARKKRITITVSADAELTARINTRLIEQAVVNLIDNAVKFSPEGREVKVVASRQQDSISIKVIDQGCGIEARHLPRMFERFYTVDRSRSRQLGGTGLGLAIVKHIVLAHGGTVSVESKVGVGSTFTINLPVP